jgi:hypothetical protein
MNFVVFAEQKVKVNWSAIVFNNLYNRLWDLFALIKSSIRKDNIEFEATQVVNILFPN